jgi:hypothetical protein
LRHQQEAEKKAIGEPPAGIAISSSQPQNPKDSLLLKRSAHWRTAGNALF